MLPIYNELFINTCEMFEKINGSEQ